MSREQKLINKVKRRERFVREPKKASYKVDKNQEVMQASPKAYKLMRKPQRLMDASFGYDAVGAEPYLEYKMVSTSLVRFDFDPGAGTDFGLRLTLPVSIAGNVGEVSKVTTAADTGDYEEFTITAPATAGATQADYFVMEAPDGDLYAFWLDIDADGTEPTGAAYLAADQQVIVAIATGDTNIQVAGKLATAMAVLSDVSVTDNSDGTLSIAYDLLGAHVDAAPHNEDDSGAGSIGIVVDNQGADSNLNSAYFLLDSPSTDYYVWYNVDSQGVDPAISGRTGVEVALVAMDSDSSVASATATEIDGLSAFSAGAVGALVTITAASSGDVPDTTDGNTGFSFSTSTQGSQASGSFENEVGFVVGDLVVIEEEGSQIENRMLEVTAVVDGRTVRLDDVATFSGTENNVTVRFILSGVKKSYL